MLNRLRRAWTDWRYPPTEGNPCGRCPTCRSGMRHQCPCVLITDYRESAAKWAQHLIRTARDLRNAGDVPLVLLDNDGVGPFYGGVTLAGELEIVALNLDYEAATAVEVGA